mgnify:CR=1 FL=1
MSLRREMITGVFWSTVQKYSGLVVQLVISAVLARLIAPEDFGVVAVATVIISFFGIFSDLGVGAAVIQNKTLTDAATGAATVILAMGAGKHAAKAIDEYLKSKK